MKRTTHIRKRKLTLALILVIGSALFLTSGYVNKGLVENEIIARASFTEAPALVPMNKSRQLVRGVLYKNAPYLEPAQIESLAGRIVQWSHAADFDPLFILALIRVESAFRPNVISYAGAIGLMQMLPYVAEAEAKALGFASLSEMAGLKHEDAPRALMHPETNVRLGIQYLAFLRDRFSNPDHYLAAYNMGPTLLASRLRRDLEPAGVYSGLVNRSYLRMLADRTDFDARIAKIPRHSQYAVYSALGSLRETVQRPQILLR